MTIAVGVDLALDSTQFEQLTGGAKGFLGRLHGDGELGRLYLKGDLSSRFLVDLVLVFGGEHLAGDLACRGDNQA